MNLNLSAPNQLLPVYFLFPPPLDIVVTLPHLSKRQISSVALGPLYQSTLKDIMALKNYNLSGLSTNIEQAVKPVLKELRLRHQHR